MTRRTNWAVIGIALLALNAQSANAGEHAEITIGYFTEWPLPMMAYKDSGEYDAALGRKVRWVSYETGPAMSAGLASGDIQFAISQGVPPFVVAVSGGQDIQALDVAVSYSENQNCVVSNNLGIDKANATELAGKTVAVPLGTAAHYGFLKQMSHFGVPVDSLEIVDMSPPEGAAALSQGAVDFACGYGGGLTRMKDYGKVLLTGEEQEAVGILVFDVTSAPTRFVAQNADLTAQFLAVTAQANAAWTSGQGGDAMLADIAKNAGMDIEDARAAIGTMRFPSVQEQLSDAWLKTNTARFMKDVADVFAAAGAIDGALKSYKDAVNTAPLAAASGL